MQRQEDRTSDRYRMHLSVLSIETTDQELIRYNLGEDFSIETAVVNSELYRHDGEWKFNAIGSGFQGGLQHSAVTMELM